MKGQSTVFDARTTQTAFLQVETSWPPATMVWSAVALLLPINSELPTVARALWFAAIGAMICIPALFLRMARPIYPAVWGFAGYASLVTVLLAPSTAAMTSYLFVGAQLILLLGLGAFTLTYNALIDPYFAQRLGIAFLAGQSLSSLVAFAQLFGVSIITPLRLSGRHDGLADHVNTQGLMASIAILLALQISLTSQKYRFVGLAAAMLNLFGLSASGSLTAVTALLFGAVVLLVCIRVSIRRLISGAIAAAVALWLTVTATGVLDHLPPFYRRYMEVTGQTRNQSTWELRKRTYEFAWKKITEDPVSGTGIDVQSSGTYNGITMVHNVVLRAWYQGGILLGIAFALIVTAMLIVVIRAVIRRECGGEASVIVAISVYSALSPVLEQRHFWLPVLVAWASISAAAIHQGTARISVLSTSASRQSFDKHHEKCPRVPARRLGRIT